MRAVVLLEAAWRDPAQVLSSLGERPWSIGFVSGGPDARWSYVATDPQDVLIIEAGDKTDPFEQLSAFACSGALDPDGPPFQGGVAGLLSYDLANRVESVGAGTLNDWPHIACGRYDAVLAFDHQARRVIAVGRALDPALAQVRAEAALGWLAVFSPEPAHGSVSLVAEEPQSYEAAVADVVERIRAGEIFQANIARRWRGALPPQARPVDLLLRLVETSPAPFATYLRLADRAVVSNSPERFLRVRREPEGLLVETLPIKGTAARGASPQEDRRLAEALLSSEKDRAENLMIVDLMRNDLARACAPGTVGTPELFTLASFANVHHLVSKVVGRLRPDLTAVDLLRAAFPPGSITGAPKVQAMKVIRRLEAPRGPFFGSMFHLGVDGALDSNVLIRTAAFVRDPAGWAVESRAGAGIVADSDPGRERCETETKMAALIAAFS